MQSINTNIFVPFLYSNPIYYHHSTQSLNNLKTYEAVSNCKVQDVSSKLTLQVLVSQLLEIKGVVSHSVRRLLLKNLNVDEKSTTENIINSAKEHIESLNRNQLFSELESIQRIEGYINFYKDYNFLGCILNIIKNQTNELKELVTNRTNKKLMENQGLGNSGLDERILTLKSDEELTKFLVALKQKEFQEKINLNFAPHRAQRIVAENHLHCTRRKICQVENEYHKRNKRKLFRMPRVCTKEPYFDAFYC